MPSIKRVTIQVQNISFSYKRQESLALDSFYLQLFEREIVCVLGHNGAGKTTLLNLIYGTLHPCTGKVVINQDIIHNYKDIFYLDAHFALNEELTVADNMQFRVALLQGDCSDAAKELERFSLQRYMDVPIKRLSSGLRQRVNLAIGFSVKPSLVLLDEPTNTIDPETRLLLEAMLKEYRQRGGSSLIVTHDLDFAYTVADRCIVIQDGVEIAQTIPNEYSTSQDFQYEYLSLTNR